MKNASRFVGVTLASWALVVGVSAAYGQRTVPDRAAAPLPAPPPTEVRTGKSMHAKAILGSKVSIQKDLAIGTVEDIIFDDDGYVDYLVVSNEGKSVVVPWEAAKFDFDKRVAVVELSQDQYRQIPTFTVEKYPDFYEPAYREKVYGWYNVKPRREIRRDRRP